MKNTLTIAPLSTPDTLTMSVWTAFSMKVCHMTAT